MLQITWQTSDKRLDKEIKFWFTGLWLPQINYEYFLTEQIFKDLKEKFSTVKFYAKTY